MYNENFDLPIQRASTHCVKYDLRQKLFDAPSAIPMWVADMDFRTPDFVIKAIQKRLEHEVLGYSFRSETYYHAIINWLETRHAWKIHKKWIAFSPGVVPALNMLVLALTQAGDGIIIQPPVYHPFRAAVNDHKRTLIENPLITISGRLSMDFDQLDELMPKAKMMIISNPHNPGGMVWEKTEIERLGQLALKHQICVVSDDIHNDLVFKPHHYTPLSSLSDVLAQQTITCIAPSKTFNMAGMATSVLIIPNTAWRMQYETLIESLHLNGGNVLGAVATEAAYTHGHEWLDRLLEYLSQNLDFAETFFTSEMPKIKFIRPEGTYLAWLDCRALQLSDEALHQFFNQKAAVILNYGSLFGTGGSGFMRMNIACPRFTLEKALIQIKNAYQTLI